MLGFGFAYHGFPKIFTAEGHQQLTGMLQGVGLPLPETTAWLVGILEFFGGLALIAGALVTLISILGAIEMIVAMVLVHLPAGFNFMNITGMTETGPVFGMPGYEVNLLYVAGFLALALGGAGAASVDTALGKREEYVAEREPAEPVGVR
jgi:putative oxidoreductase